MSHGNQTPGQGAPAAFAGVPAPGELIASKYEVERVLGVGGMGVVLAARHVQLGQRVAIKFMRLEAARETNAANRFLREARAAVALSSEHVTKVLDVGTLENGAPYMVMEYLAGSDLSELLRQNGPLAVGSAMSVVLQACEAIAEAHVLGIIHRDLKPSNLFVTKRRDGTPLVKVLDFGISKTVELNTVGARESLTASGLMIGSPWYMSPEQLRSAKEADARSDIWSLGVILYELLTGKTPFAGETLGETLVKIVTEPVPPIRKRRPDIPKGLAAAIMRCLERDVDRRVQTIGELAVKLAPFAPREAEISVERIARVSVPGGRTAAAETPAARSSTMTASAPSGSRGISWPRGSETGPAWLTSKDSPVEGRRPFRLRRFATVTAVGIAVAAGVAGLSRYGGLRARQAQGLTAGLPEAERSAPAAAVAPATSASPPSSAPPLASEPALAAPVKLEPAASAAPLGRPDEPPAAMSTTALGHAELDHAAVDAGPLGMAQATLGAPRRLPGKKRVAKPAHAEPAASAPSDEDLLEQRQ